MVQTVGLVLCPGFVAGALITLAALAFCAQVFLAVDRKSHSVSDTFYSVFPFFAGTFLLFDWIAGRTSTKTQREKQSGPSRTR